MGYIKRLLCNQVTFIRKYHWDQWRPVTSNFWALMTVVDCFLQCVRSNRLFATFTESVCRFTFC